ncbi:S41 family peptidase [Porticoccaceae bacterium]|nr:S41 family peptidase [Porticoccaceae bacterium]
MKKKLIFYLFTAHLIAGMSPFTIAQAANPPPTTLPLSELRLFTQVFDQVRRGYVDEVSDSELLISSIEGMLFKLDPYSRYLDRDQYRQLQQLTSDNYAGIGVEVAAEDGLIRVISPLDQSPAARAGIRSGDLIIAIDGASLRELSPSRATDKLRGKSGSPVQLTLMRSSLDDPLDVTLSREMINIDSVRYRQLDYGIGYIRIAQFQEQTARAFARALDELQKEPFAGLILDLRNNPGGLVSSAVDIASSLLDGDTVVYTEGRINTANQLLSADLGDSLNGLPIVILINEGSASAAEIVAGAIQDNRRGVVLGTRSFGKGSVQTIIPIEGGRALKLTTARYFTPSGRSIQAEGIDPDIVVVRGQFKPAEANLAVREENLGGHLENIENSSQSEQHAIREEDNQLAEAINVLRAVSLLRD